MIIGLRIDVDTLRGTRLGVPTLNDIFAKHGIQATYFFSVGPDNMGRHLFRLLRPAFFKKMLRTRAAKLYGWDVLLRGTLWPGTIIGEREKETIKITSDLGHEIGLHAWDHHAWQARIDSWSQRDVEDHLDRGLSLLTRIVGHAPAASAAPGWKCNDNVLLAKEKFPFAYNSDCRGASIFLPIVSDASLSQPQVPTTLPSFDEVVGLGGIDAGNYNEFLLSSLNPNKLQVLTIHAEAEGILCSEMFDQFLSKAQRRGVKFVPLVELVRGQPLPAPGRVVAGSIPGREGWIGQQELGGRGTALASSTPLKPHALRVGVGI